MSRYLVHSLPKCLVLTLILTIVLIFWKYHELKKIGDQENFNEIARSSTIKEFISNAYQDMSDDAFKRFESSFYVYNSKCKIPKPNPFTPEAMATFQLPKVVACTEQPDVIVVHYEADLRQYRLHVHEERLQNITTFERGDKFGCYYSEIKAAESPHTDDYSIIGPTVYFLQDELLPQAINNVLVCCHLYNRNLTIQEDAFALVQAGLQPTASKSRSAHKPSVIMLGLDSLSRINLQRTMPKTVAFLQQRGWLELQGYNKIGDNTFPNLLALLTGLTVKGANVVCDINTLGCYERLHFIWDFFKRSGYKTAYAEDYASVTTFNYMRKGFMRAPVDYYMRPFFVAVEKALSEHFNYCAGRRSSFDSIFRYCLDFVTRFIHEAPFFGLFWSSTVTHDDAFGAATIDDKFVHYLQQYERLGLFEQAIVIFFSDHGQRYGPLNELPEGFLEERLPLLYISLPAWFQQQYPSYAAALRHNRNRLTSPFDLHMTLQHIIELARPGLRLSRSANCAKGQSLFLPVPNERTCAQACIPLHWCTCDPYTTVMQDRYIMFVVKMVIQRINAYLSNIRLAKFCRRLHLHEILKAERKLSFNEHGEVMKAGNIVIYRIKFETSAKAGRFQATVVVDKHNNEFENFDVTTISRLDLYRNHSYCIQHKIAKKFCFCI